MIFPKTSFVYPRMWEIQCTNFFGYLCVKFHPRENNSHRYHILDILDGIVASINQYVELLNVLISHIQLNVLKNNVSLTNT